MSLSRILEHNKFPRILTVFTLLRYERRKTDSHNWLDKRKRVNTFQRHEKVCTTSAPLTTLLYRYALYNQLRLIKSKNKFHVRNTLTLRFVSRNILIGREKNSIWIIMNNTITISYSQFNSQFTLYIDP